MKGQTFVIIGSLIAIIIAIFSVLNVGAVNVNYWLWQGESPLILVILISALLGILISAAVSGYKIIQLQREVKSMKSQISIMEKALEDNNFEEELPKKIETNEIEEDKETTEDFKNNY